MATDPDSDPAREHFRDGVRHYEAGELEAAQSSFSASLALDPGRPSTTVRLASTRLKFGDAEEALRLVAPVIEANPRNVDALGVRAGALATLGHFPNALEAVDQVLAAAPKNVQAWTMRGNLLRVLGRFEEAAQCFGRAAQQSDDPDILSYYAAAGGGEAPPPTAPRAYVQALFDSYAPNYDSELVDTLNYRTPALLVAGVEKLGRHFNRGLDLGCGTGLCAPLARPLVDALDGVDLSPRMVEHARERNLYDELHVGDITEFLSGSAREWDLVISADVFIYVGRLEPVFAALAPRMPAGGVCCFSVEAHDGPEPLVLLPTRRYAHSEACVREVAAGHGFEVLDLSRAAIRDQRDQPITGLCVWLQRT